MIGCTDTGKVISAINNLVDSSNQSFDVIFTSIEQMTQKESIKKLDLDSLIPKENPIIKPKFNGYHNSKRKQLRNGRFT